MRKVKPPVSAVCNEGELTFVFKNMCECVFQVRHIKLLYLWGQLSPRIEMAPVPTEDGANGLIRFCL